MGSVIIVKLYSQKNNYIKLPTRLGDTWDLTAQSSFPETNSTHTEFAKKRPRPAANMTPVVLAHFKFLFPLRLGD